MHFSIISLLAPAHLLTYSTLLGTELYQTFVMTKISYQVLPRSAFTTLQRRAFPVYFQSQSLLLLVVAATAPPYGPASLMRNKMEWMGLAIASVTAGFNLLVYGPRTKELMIERVHQATRDARIQSGAAFVSGEMKNLNRSFSQAHAMSIHLNLITIGATLFYGWRLGTKLQFDGV